jgi:hypothetical protein
MIERGDHLVERLRSGARDDSANELLELVFAGYPVDNLLRLTRSDEPVAVGSGAWIISELGPGSAALMEEVARLLEHPVRQARFWAVDAVLAGATTAHGEVIAKAVTLLADPDEAVRWKVLQLLAAIPADHLAAGLPNLTDPHVVRLVTWLTSVDADPIGARDVESRLAGADRLTRLVAAAAAARLAPRTVDLLERAAAAEDEEVRSFAKSELRVRSASRR